MGNPQCHFALQPLEIQRCSCFATASNSIACPALPIPCQSGSPLANNSAYKVPEESSGETSTNYSVLDLSSHPDFTDSFPRYEHDK